MSNVITVPDKLPDFEKTYTIFLAGSLKIATSECWQDSAIKQLNNDPIVRNNYIILNPRVRTIDSESDNQSFRNVEWELEALEKCDIIMMYLSPNSISPTSFMELGMVYKDSRLHICCPEDPYLDGNVGILCKKYDIHSYKTMDELIKSVKEIASCYVW